MLLPQTAEYALRAMAFFAGQPVGTPVRAKDLAPRVGVPLFYLSKILRRMVICGLLDSQKGHGGGFCLTRAPSTIRLRDVLAAADFAPVAGRCAFGWGQCDAGNPCPLHPLWSRLNESFRAWGGLSLAEVGAWKEMQLRAHEAPRRSSAASASDVVGAESPPSAREPAAPRPRGSARAAKASLPGAGRSAAKAVSAKRAPRRGST